jgi:hypothetical protein
MIIAIILGHIAVGLALGARFRVVALVPASVVSIATVSVSAVAASLGLAWSAVAVIAALSALQVSFLAGAALRDRMTGPLAHPVAVAVRAGR